MLYQGLYSSNAAKGKILYVEGFRREVYAMPGVTKEQIARAKEWDLLSYLRTHEPQELKRCGGNEYCTVSHDSLKISNGRWHWHSQGIGGRTALDYLIKVQGMEFVPAVEALCGGYGRAVSGRPDTEMVEVAKKHLVLPERNRYGTAAVSYLQRRGIDGDIISHCIGEGLLYESRHYQNCVFLGKDTAGEIRYAFLRGIHGQFAGDAEGSDKRYGFALLSADRESPFLAVAESPIDALSLATLSKMQGKDWTGKHYLSLGGTSPCALVQFLEDHWTVAYIVWIMMKPGWPVWKESAGQFGNPRLFLAGCGRSGSARRQYPVARTTMICCRRRGQGR